MDRILRYYNLAHSPNHHYNFFKKYITKGLDDDVIDCYGKISQFVPTTEDHFKVTISLVTLNMYKADFQFFSRFISLETSAVFESGSDGAFENYRPYIYEFIAEIDSDQKNHLSKYQERWFNVQIHNYSDSTSNKDVINGTELFSASPLIAKNKTLVFNPGSKTDPNCKLLDKLYTKSNLNSITGHAINKISNLSPIESFLSNKLKSVQGMVYSVGLANNSKIILKDNTGNTFEFLYDLGKTYLKSVLKRPEVKSGITLFKSSHFDAVILSHWDIDHILAIGDYDPRSLYNRNKLWIAPDINMLLLNEVSTSALRLACYISQSCNTFLFNDPGSNIKFNVPYDNFQIWQGKAHSSGTATHQNNIGLLINIFGAGEYHVTSGIMHTSVTQAYLNNTSNSNIDLLMCGDCVYDNWPDVLKDQEHNILWVPHHGTNKAIPQDHELKTTENGIAIISADDSKYKTPFPGKDHISALVDKGYSHIFVTKQSGSVYFNIIYN